MFKEVIWLIVWSTYDGYICGDGFQKCNGRNWSTEGKMEWNGGHMVDIM